MKRIVSVFLLLVFVSAVIIAEGQGENGAAAKASDMDLGGRVLTYMAWWDPASTDEVWLSKLAFLEEQYNFKLETRNSGDWQGHHDDLLASIAAGDPVADYVYIDQGFFPGFVSEQLLEPVEGYGIDFSQPHYHQGKREAFTLKGHEYSIKDQFIEPSAGWWFNKSLLDREGQPDIYELQRNGEWTWDKMLEIAKAVTRDLDGDGNIDQWGFAEDPLHVAAMALIAGNGANILDDGKFGLASPAAIEALQFYQDLNIKHKVVGMRPEDSEWNWAYHEFGAGKVAFLPFFFWASDSQFGTPEDEIGWALFPAGPKGGMTSVYYPNNTVVVPVGVKDVKTVLQVWDQLWKPHPDFIDPDEDPFSWLYTKFYDIESVEETQRMMSVGGKFTTFTHELFGLKTTWESLPLPILKGEKSPQVAVEEAQPIFEGKIADVLGE
ncbi:MAG: extracellular solute-binding protein [Spirochaetales bacterium]|nr:extracellular solute-binding protein [Spirochaetales bacterium]